MFERTLGVRSVVRFHLLEPVFMPVGFAIYSLNPCSCEKKSMGAI